MTPAIARPATSHYRWIICALLFFATVISYMDRGVLGYLEKYLEGIFHFDSVQYSYMTTAFQIAYAIGLVTAGWLTDRLGTRKGFALAIGLWSLAAMTPGAATGVWTFCFAMFFLGLGEAANFPACNKTVAEWFPKKERALAFGIFNSGANIGNIAVPMVVPALVFAVGWRGAFVVAGALGLVWLCFWLWLYRKPEEHRKVSAQELAHIQSDPPEKTERVRLGPPASAEGDLGVCRGQDAHRPHLVVLPLLAAPLPAGDLPHEHQHQPDSHRCGLRHLHAWAASAADCSLPPCSEAAGVSMPRARPPC